LRCCSCWALSFTTRIDDVIVDAGSLPMNRIRVELRQVLGPTVFRVLDVDPSPAAYIDAGYGFMLTFTQQPTFHDLRVARDAIVAFYRLGNIID